MLFTIFTGYH